MREQFLTEGQWAKIEKLLPKKKSKGRPWVGNREVLEGILWVLRSGARWRDLPDWYPSASTCWRRLKDWEEEGIWLKMWRAFLAELDEEGTLNWGEIFLDGSFVLAKKGGSAWVKPNVEKVQNGWWWSTARVYLSEAKLPRHLPVR